MVVVIIKDNGNAVAKGRGAGSVLLQQTIYAVFEACRAAKDLADKSTSKELNEIHRELLLDAVNYGLDGRTMDAMVARSKIALRGFLEKDKNNGN